MATNISRAGNGVVTFDFGVGIDPLVLSDSNNVVVSSSETKDSLGTIIRQDLSFMREDPYFFYQIAYSQIGTINGSPKPAIGSDTTDLFESAVFQGTGGSSSNPPNLLIAATDASGAIVDGTANVIARTLNGFTLGANSTVVAGDTILGAFGKVQTQVTDRVNLTGAQTVAGVKTFSSIPVLPAAAPTTANQATNKTYVDTGDNRTPTGSVRGGVLLQAAIPDLAGAPTMADFNGLLAALRLSGVLTP